MFHREGCGLGFRILPEVFAVHRHETEEDTERVRV